MLGALVAACLYEVIRGGEEHAQGVPNALRTSPAAPRIRH
jgi:hypothetical protein